jgi:hypothetical protein
VGKGYQRYLASPGWQATRQEALMRAGRRCRHCGAPDALEVHHLTYERLGNERPDDLAVLCRDCHQLEHDTKGTPMKNEGTTTTNKHSLVGYWYFRPVPRGGDLGDFEGGYVEAEIAPQVYVVRGVSEYLGYLAARFVRLDEMLASEPPWQM